VSFFLHIVKQIVRDQSGRDICLFCGLRHCSFRALLVLFFCLPSCDKPFFPVCVCVCVCVFIVQASTGTGRPDHCSMGRRGGDDPPRTTSFLFLAYLQKLDGGDAT
jgi:hypothetical protein